VARPERLSRLTYLVEARSSLAHSGPARAWGGARKLCVRDGNFTRKQPPSQAACPAGFPLGFAVVNTEGKPDWTMTFDENPPIASLEAAQLAGVRRLLKDNGYKVGPLTGTPDKATGTALVDFRRTLPPDADNAALFAALEKAAQAKVAPAGLTACNDSKKPLLVALGKDGHGKKTARGWWTVAAGACARLQTTPLAQDHMYILARGADKVVVKGGAVKFCVAGAAFEIADAQTRCVARGFEDAGFAPLDGHGAAGLIVYMGTPIRR
jgi:uncharacterized membrane protein